MFRHVRVTIRELTCESNAMAVNALRYTWLCVWYVEAWYAPNGMHRMVRTRKDMAITEV
jgi:hypothetical protein